MHDLMGGQFTNDKHIASKAAIRKIANDVIKKEYHFDDNNRAIYENLLLYFLGQKQSSYNLNKGIFLYGDYGTGKSTIFRIFHTFIKTYFPWNKNMFRISSVEDLLNDASNDEINFLNSVSIFNVKENYNGIKTRKPIHILVNEFGHAYKIKNYGTDVNEMIDMFLMKRYDIFQEHRKLTHVTSNYSPLQLENIYSTRIVDRFKEMFNIIHIKGSSRRN